MHSLMSRKIVFQKEMNFCFLFWNEGNRSRWGNEQPSPVFHISHPATPDQHLYYRQCYRCGETVQACGLWAADQQWSDNAGGPGLWQRAAISLLSHQCYSGSGGKEVYSLIQSDATLPQNTWKNIQYLMCLQYQFGWKYLRHFIYCPNTVKKN